MRTICIEQHARTGGKFIIYQFSWDFDLTWNLTDFYKKWQNLTGFWVWMLKIIARMGHAIWRKVQAALRRRPGYPVAASYKDAPAVGNGRVPAVMTASHNFGECHKYYLFSAALIMNGHWIVIAWGLSECNIYWKSLLPFPEIFVWHHKYTDDSFPLSMKIQGNWSWHWCFTTGRTNKAKSNLNK